MTSQKLVVYKIWRNTRFNIVFTEMDDIINGKDASDEHPQGY